MPTVQEPVMGNWYRQHDDSRKFQVVAIEKETDLIKIQYTDGSVEDLDFAAWRQLDLHLADAPDK